MVRRQECAIDYICSKSCCAQNSDPLDRIALIVCHCDRGDLGDRNIRYIMFGVERQRSNGILKGSELHRHYFLFGVVHIDSPLFP